MYQASAQPRTRQKHQLYNLIQGQQKGQKALAPFAKATPRLLPQVPPKAQLRMPRQRLPVEIKSKKALYQTRQKWI